MMVLFKIGKTINYMCDKYAKHTDEKSMRTVLSNIRYIRQYFGKYTAGQIKPQMIDEYKEKRLSESASNTVRREVAVFHSMVNIYLKEVKKYSRDYKNCKRLLEAISENRPPKVIRKVVLSLEHLKQIMEYLPEPMKRMATCAYMIGWRHNELAKLRWRQVSLKEKSVTLLDSKNGKGRTSLMYGKLYDFFKSIHNGQDPNDLVFESWNYYTWRKACIKAGFVDDNGKAEYRLHDCRKLCVRFLLENVKLDQDTIIDVFTGHKSKQIFEEVYNLRNTATYVNFYKKEVLSK